MPLCLFIETTFHDYLYLLYVPIYFSVSGYLDLEELMKQQLRLGLLKACRKLFSHQEKLRQILCQNVSQEQTTVELDTSGNMSSDDELGDCGDTPTTLLQQLMLTATQPSPLKAVFPRDELEVSISFK